MCVLHPHIVPGALSTQRHISPLPGHLLCRFTSPPVTIQNQDTDVPAGYDALDVDPDVETILARAVSAGGVYVLCYAGCHGLGEVHLTVDTRRCVLIHTDPGIQNSCTTKMWMVLSTGWHIKRPLD